MDIDEEELEIDTQAADTIGGLAVEIAGRILGPEESLIIGNFKLIVETSDKKRIKMIKAIKIGNEN